MSNDADLLRRAATAMRERAQAATPSPWFALYDEPWFGNQQLAWDYDNGRVSEVEYMDAPDSPATLFHGDVVHKADTAHIVSWHPAVALYVAAWLDEAADETDGIERLYAEHFDKPRPEWARRTAARAVARTYLGQTA